MLPRHQPAPLRPSPLVLGLGSLLAALSASQHASVPTPTTPPEVQFVVIGDRTQQLIQEAVDLVDAEFVDSLAETHPLHRAGAQRTLGPTQMLHHPRSALERSTFSPIHDESRFRSEAMTEATSGQ